MPHRENSKETSYRLRCTTQELKAWHAAAASLGLSLADFIRAGIELMNRYRGPQASRPRRR
jgi:hypothetical protein